MNTYNLAISGSWWILILLFAAAFALSYWAYKRTIPQISGKKKSLLIGLRTLGLLLLLFALFEPIYSVVRSYIDEPHTAILLDNSVSAAATDASVDREKIYKSAMEKANLDKLANATFKFDEGVNSLEKYSFDSLDFQGQATDISKAIRRVSSTIDEQNVKAVVMFTDGAFNSGSNPVFDAERLGKPFFIVGIGDTIEPNDLSIVSILTNETAYIDNPVPITINVKANGFDGKTAKLSIFDNNQKIGEYEFLIEANREKYSYTLEYLPKTEGIRKITATVGAMKNEITDKNNSLSEFIRVLKNKRNISIFAGAPSPDVSFIKQSLLLEKGVELKEYIQKQGAEFYQAPTQSELNAAEVIVLIGFPIQSTPKNVIDMIAKELERGKPLMFVASQNVDYNKLKDLQNYLPFVIVSSRPNEFLALPDIKQSSLSSPLLRVTGSEDDAKLWNKLPPLFRTETFVRVKPESEIVSTMKINNSPLNDPLIVTRHFQNSKSVAMLGYGLYRWKLLGYASEVSKGRADATDLFSVLVNNSMRWLSIAEQGKPVKLKTSRKVYNQSDVVEFLGEIYDASYSPVDKANFAVKVSGGGEQRELLLSSLGSGRYYGTVSGLPEGDFSFSGAAEFAGRKLGEDNGRFSIGEIALEYQNLKMNISLLKAIAERTGGKFYFPDEAENMANDIENHKSYTARSSKQKNDILIWNLPYLLGLAILLFSIEWFVRKRAGMI